MIAELFLIKSYCIKLTKAYWIIVTSLSNNIIININAINLRRAFSPK